MIPFPDAVYELLKSSIKCRIYTWKALKYANSDHQNISICFPLLATATELRLHIWLPEGCSV